MGYVAKKVRVKSDGEVYWQVVFEDRRKDRPESLSRETPIHRNQLRAIGIDPLDDFGTAKAKCQQLNSKARLDKAAERKKVRALKRQSGDALVKSAFLPEQDVREFEERVLFRRLAGDEESLRYNRLLSHWAYVQRMIADLQIEPKDYADECFVFYRYFERKRTSPAYATKILRILNAWGQFFTKHHGGTGIMEIKMPRGKQRQDIVRAYRKKDTFKGEADPLTPSELKRKEPQLLPHNFQWLYLATWLGLRPEEVDSLRDRGTWRIEKVQGIKVIWVFQSKLVSVDEDKAWKPIPLILPEQLDCIKIIAAGNFRRPLNKVLRKAFPEKRITTYSGRKAFTDLMLSFGQPLEEISIWLGHKSIETTWKHYKQKQVVRFNRVA